MEPDREPAVASGQKSVTEAGLRATLRRLISETCGIPPAELDDTRPLAEYGLTSRAAVALTGHLEQALDRPLRATLLWENPTVERLVRHLATVQRPEPVAGNPAESHESRPAAADARPARNAAETPPRACPIAVIGIGCRLPGRVDGPDALWQHLLAGSDLTGHVPAKRWRDFVTGPGAAALLERTPRQGAFLDDIETFDADHFGITPREAEVMDPQQRLLLEVACEALDHAGRPAHTLEGTDTGVFVGLSALEYGHLTTADPTRLTPWTSTGAAGSIVANRLSYLFDLHGPSLTVDTACSSSLVAVHQACRSLRDGECDTALAAGVNVLLSPTVTSSLEHAGVLAADGRCKPFDAAANGIIRGEGCGVVVLKRLADAQRDGDRILAVVKGSAVNSDGRSAGLMAPNPAAQKDLLRSALRDAQVEADSIDYVEAHGTGTMLGDPMEAGSMGAVLGGARTADQPLLIGSVKSNLGHLEGAAGIVGFIKTVLALHHDRIPHTLHFRTPNPHIDFTGLRLRVVTEPVAWPEGRYGPARAGVSAFGFGGTNAHVILERAPAHSPSREIRPPQALDADDDHTGTPHVLIVSARSGDRIGDAAEGLARRLAADGAPTLRDLSHTLARFRRGPVCAAVVARTHQEATGRLAALARGEEVTGLVSARTDDSAGRSSGTRHPVFVFSGHGSHWPGMGLRLMREDSLFADAVRELDPLYEAQAGASLTDMLSLPEYWAGVDRVQPLVFGMQIALSRTLQSYGVHPAAVMGHSMGEIGAAVTAGALDPADGLRVILRRSAELAAIGIERAGAMAAVELSEQERARVLSRFPGIEIAVYASPRRCTVTGPPDTVQRLVDELTAEGRFARILEIGAAAHSPAVDTAVPKLREALAGLRPRKPEVPWYSTVLDDPGAEVHADAAYWCANVRSPVRQQQAVRAAAAAGHDLFLEISPHAVAVIPLSEALQAAQDDSEAEVIPTLHRRRDEAVDLRTALARLHLAGVRLDQDHVWPRGTQVALPTPAWHHERHWFGRRGSVTTSPVAGHPLLGLRVDDPRTGAVLWQADVGTDTAHAPRRRIHGRPVLDLAAAAALLIAAAQEIHGRDRIDDLRIEELAIHRWLPLSGSTPATIVWEPTGPYARVTVNSRATDGAWHCHASARLHTDPVPPPADVSAPPPSAVSHSTFTAGEEPNPHSADEELLGAVLYAPVATATTGVGHDASHVDFASAEIIPAALRCLHVQGLAPDGSTYDVQCFPDPGTTAEPAPGTAAESTEPGSRWNVVAVGSQRRITAQGLELRPTRRDEVPQHLHALAYEIQWQKASVPLPGPLGSALLLADDLPDGDGALTAALSAALEARSVRTTIQAGRAVDDGQPVEDWLRSTGQGDPGAVVLLLTGRTEADATAALHRAAQIARRLASHGSRTPQPPRLWLVTVQARAATPGEAGEPHLACLRGLVRALAIEEPTLRASLVDIDTQPEGVDDLARELLGNSPEDEVVWRAGTRLVARLARADLTEQQYEVPFARRDGAYLVTGGLTGLGLETARRLAEQGAGRLVLNGRRSATPESQGVIAELRARGTSVAVVQGDIADPDVAPRLVQAAVSEGHTLRGVAHCAAVLHDRMITDLEPADIDTVLRPKVTGALNLEAALASHDIDWWVSYSSVAALLGSPGQAAYAAANAWLDAIAHRRRAEGRPAVSIAWGPWSGAGAAPTHRALAMDYLTVPEGLDALQTLVVHNRTHTGVVHFDAQRLLEAFPSLSALPFFADSLRTDATAMEDWGGPARIEGLGDAAAGTVYSRLVRRTAAIMGFSPANLNDAVPLTELGLDSLMAVRIRNAARQDFAVEVPSDLLLRGATLREIGENVLEGLGLEFERGRDTEDGAASPAGADAHQDATASSSVVPPELPRTIQPRDAAERLVAGAWAEVLRERPADVHADFVEAGGNQRSAGALVDAIRRRLGDARPNLTTETVLGQRTVAAIAELIRPTVNPTGESPVNALRPPLPGSSQPPLFTFHPAGGPTSVYQPLTQLLPADQAVYGMERLDGVGTMEEKAAHYVTLIREIQPQGPYRLLGWSFGGCLAYETAQQLTDAGEAVDFLGLIDTILAAALPDLDSSDLLLRRFGRFAEYIEKTYGHRLDLDYDELAATPDDQQIDVVMRLVSEAGLDMSPGIMEHQRTSYIDARVGERYTPRPYDGHVVLYRAQQAQPLTTALDPRYLRQEADLGWAPLCPSLEVVPVEGDHLSLIDPPSVATIARHLRQCFAASSR
ncbi:SDR family NAD(P)-dependent oxidoreductase [Streptomyces sp900129855]|uniref:SDR family NAD(P)-dependent oxidoreductase n=1 Tax=Streptomyces sp. 900129855 TaxID=3155129 RepID=A0ABV2ZPK9_9ACTN